MHATAHCAPRQRNDATVLTVARVLRVHAPRERLGGVTRLRRCHELRVRDAREADVGPERDALIDGQVLLHARDEDGGGCRGRVACVVGGGRGEWRGAHARLPTAQPLRAREPYPPVRHGSSNHPRTAERPWSDGGGGAR